MSPINKIIKYIKSLVWTAQGGGLNSDISLTDISGGDMPDGLNARAVGEGLNVTPDYEIIRGNAFIAQVEDVIAQNKIFRIFVDCGIVAPDSSADVTVYDQNNNIVNAPNNFPITFNNFAATVVDLELAFDAILGSLNYNSSSQTLSASTGYFFVEIINDIIGNPIPYNEWSINFSNILPQPPTISFNVVVIQEAIDKGLEGTQQCLGSRYNEVSWEFWTSQKREIVYLNITDVDDNGSGVIRVTVSSTALIIDLSTVIIVGVLGAVEANGKWIATVINGTQIDLLGSVFGAAYVSGGQVTINPFGIGEIGIVIKDDNLLTYQYIRLLRTKEWNFRTEHQIDVVVEKNAAKWSVYWNDFYNLDRVFYYNTAFATDGGLSLNGGQYEYESISEETALIQNFFKARVNFVSVSNAGGQVLSGNHLYFVRGQSLSLTTTVFSEPSGLINIYLADPGAPEKVIGDDAGVPSTKIVNLLVTGITPNAYKYIQLIDVNFVGGAVTAQMVKKVIMPPGASSIEISHTGFETESVSLDPGTINTLFTPFPISRSIAILQNHLVRYNLKGYNQIDLSPFFASFYHSLQKKTIPTVGCINSTPTNGTYHLSTNEYMLPIHVNMDIGYMPNECYRFMGKARFKQAYGGAMSELFWIDDIIFDTNPYNIDPAYPDNRRGNGLIDWSLTDSYLNDTSGVAAPNPYAFYLSFYDMDLSMTIPVNGANIAVRDLIDSFYIERVVCDEPVQEVRGSGIAVLGVSGLFDAFSDTGANPLYYNGSYGPGGTWGGQYPFISGHTFVAHNGFGGNYIPDNPTYDTVTGYTLERTYASLYVPDVMWNQSDIQYQVNDRILNYGAAERNETFGFVVINSNGAKTFDCHYTEYGGFVGNNLTNVQSSHLVDELQVIDFNSHFNFIAGLDYAKRLIMQDLPVSANFRTWANPRSPVAVVTTNITNGAAVNVDRGVYVIRYYRGKSVYNAQYDPDTSKYGIRTNSLGIPTGAFYDITPDSPNIIPVSTINVFGGDAMVQKTYMNSRSILEDQVGVVADLGFGEGISFYSANRMNAQMRRKETPISQPLFPEKTLALWLETPHSGDPYFYNVGYTPRNPINVHNSFDPNIEQITAYPTRIDYSNNKPNDSLIDTYREVLPGNFYDDDMTNGHGVDMFVWNGELITRQRDAVNHHYFDTSALVAQTDGSVAITGNGGYLKRRPTKISQIGSENKWARIMGISKGGNDVAYWYNPLQKQWVRYGYDGTNPISDTHSMQTFFAKWSNWVIGKDTPVHSQGIHGVWNERFHEAIMTFRGHKSVDQWDEDTEYDFGNEVSSSTVIPTQYQFLQQYQIYIALQLVPAGTPLDDTDYWFPVPHFGDPVTINLLDPPDIIPTVINPADYYSEFTMVFNEIKNKFQPRQSCIPNIYMPFRDTYFSPRPIEPTGYIYLHDKGRYAEWYDLARVSQQEDGFIIPVYNIPKDVIKSFIAIRIDSEITPYYAVLVTDNGTTLIDATDFKMREKLYNSTIFKDITITDDPKANGSMMYGKYIVVKIYMQPLFYQRIANVIIKQRFRARLYTD